MRSTLSPQMRLFRIDQILTERGYVPAVDLIAELKCAEPTLKRDLRYMRKHLNAPIIYDAKRRGYYYKGVNKKQRKPAMWYSPTEMYAVLTVLRLFDKVEGEKGGLLSSEMKAMKTRLLSIISDEKLPVREVDRRIKVMGEDMVPMENPYFEVLGSAIVSKKRLTIRYFTRSSNTTKDREISPQRLVNYKQRWYLDAWDHESDSTKTFRVSQIQYAAVIPAPIKIVAMPILGAKFDSSYGIYSGTNIQTAVIEVDSTMGEYVKDEIWHSEQKITVKDDGSLTLEVPYASEIEITNRILSLGFHAVVASPSSLRRTVKTALETALGKYDEAAKPAATKATASAAKPAAEKTETAAAKSTAEKTTTTTARKRAVKK